jgi:hypothetical protein
MAHVSLEWSHGVTYDDTRCTDVTKRGGGSCFGLTNEDVDLLILGQVDCVTSWSKP